MTARQLFIVVATGNRVANLPPILERAQPGDRVLWVESKEALDRRWSEGSRRVLEQHGLEHVEPSVRVEQINDPVEMAQRCAPFVQQLQDPHLRPVLVMNGGQKLSPIGLLRAWEAHQPIILYGSDRPAVLWTFEEGLGRSPSIRPYVRHRLDLDDILTVSGHLRIAGKDGPARQLWPSSELPRDLLEEAYAVDPVYTGRLHSDHYHWARAERRSDGPVSYDQVLRLVPPQRLANWRQSLRQVTSAINRTVEKSLYHATLNLAETAASFDARSGLSIPTTDLGSSLERAAARRVVLAMNEPLARAVQSVWANVVVAREDSPETSVAEWDVVVVLRNGILFGLECKTATAEQKDLDARLLNLQLAGSSLAEMALCIPLFTAFAAEPWFAALHTMRQRADRLKRLAFLPMTLAGQPETYSVAAEDERPFSCPTFEAALEKILRPYIP